MSDKSGADAPLTDEQIAELIDLSERDWDVPNEVGVACRELKQRRAQAVSSQPVRPVDRCPNCSFQPTSMNDFCDEHRPKSAQPVSHEFAPDGSGTFCMTCGKHCTDAEHIHQQRTVSAHPSHNIEGDGCTRCCNVEPRWLALPCPDAPKEAQPVSARPDVERLKVVAEHLRDEARISRVSAATMNADAKAVTLAAAKWFTESASLIEALARVPAPADSVDLEQIARRTHHALDSEACDGPGCDGCAIILAALQRARKEGAPK